MQDTKDGIMESETKLTTSSSNSGSRMMHTVSTGKPINKTMDHVHKLERKHSSGDLHSRLKTRKLLGVGETDDGDVHRSKLSQILGHSEQLYVKLPRGLRVWQFVVSLVFTVLAIWALFFPQHLFSVLLSDSGESQVIFPLRLYGGAMLGLSVVSWNTLYCFDKDIIKWTLMASCVYFGVQTLVTALTIVQLCLYLSRLTWFLLHNIAQGTAAYYFSLAMADKHVAKLRSASKSEISTKTD